MIYTITPNPALDISGSVDELVSNEKSYVRQEIRSPGGNGINAARISTRLGAKVIATGFMGGMTGQEIKFMLDEEKVRHDFISISGHTRFNVTISSEKTHKQTRLSFPGPTIKGSELKNLLEYVDKIEDEALVVLGGSLPQGVKPLHIAKLVHRLKVRGIPCLVDMTGPILQETISSQPFFIKPNLTEFQQMVNKKVDKINTILPIARRLTEKVPMICISSVEGGALLVTKEAVWFGKIPRVKVLSSVGAGDSMVGSMSTCLWKHKENDPKKLEGHVIKNGGEILRWGLAAACGTLTQAGMDLASKRSILDYFDDIQIRTVRT